MNSFKELVKTHQQYQEDARLSKTDFARNISKYGPQCASEKQDRDHNIAE